MVGKMRNIGSFAAAVVLVVFSSFSQAGATTIDTNWFSNATSNTNVIDPPFMGQPPERLRLQGGAMSGFIEGTVFLPFSDTWTIETTVFADTDPARDPNEFVKIFIDGIELAQFFNTPAGMIFPFSTDITGDHFDYRFEFMSGTAIEDQHMIVGVGTASVPMPEPGALAILSIGLVGLGLARRRRTA